MITYEMIKDAQEFIVENWGDDGKNVIKECHAVNPFNGSFEQFLKHCFACGGNWGGMILTGINKLYPSVYEAIPDNMGIFAFSCLCSILVLCGVDTSKE